MFHTVMHHAPAVIERYPRELPLPDGSTVRAASVTLNDRRRLEEYLAKVPGEDQTFLWHDVALIIDRCCALIDEAHALSLLVWDDEGVVADGILHRDPGLWTTHVGKLRLFVLPEARRRGIGAAVVRELLDMARVFDLHKVVAECTPEQTGLLTLLRQFDFREAARLKGFIRDRHGQLHDMALLVHDVR